MLDDFGADNDVKELICEGQAVTRSTIEISFPAVLFEKVIRLYGNVDCMGSVENYRLSRTAANGKKLFSAGAELLENLIAGLVPIVFINDRESFNVGFCGSKIFFCDVHGCPHSPH